MIIGLTGLKGSGKDTTGAYLVKQHGFERRAFADIIKRSVAALLDIPFSEIDRLKNDNFSGIAVHTSLYTAAISQSFRSFLQRYGAEAHRDIFGDDFWLDHTLPVGGYYGGRKIVVTDVRFENEAQRIRVLGGEVWQINRPGTSNIDQHASEQLPSNVYRFVENNGTIDELYDSIEEMLCLLLL